MVCRIVSEFMIYQSDMIRYCSICVMSSFVFQIPDAVWVFIWLSVVADYGEPFGRTEHDGELEVIEKYALVGMQNINPIA